VVTPTSLDRVGDTAGIEARDDTKSTAGEMIAMPCGRDGNTRPPDDARSRTAGRVTHPAHHWELGRGKSDAGRLSRVFGMVARSTGLLLPDAAGRNVA